MERSAAEHNEQIHSPGSEPPPNKWDGYAQTPCPICGSHYYRVQRNRTAKRLGSPLALVLPKNAYCAKCKRKR